VNELFAEKVVTDRRTYFFDVKETREGSMYVVIGEVAQFGNDTARHRVMLFEENIDAFLAGLQKSVAHIRGVRGISDQDLPMRGEDTPDEEAPAESSGKSGGAVREILGRLTRGKREQSDPDAESIKATLRRIEAAVEQIREHFS
jgi:hypothetical protein